MNSDIATAKPAVLGALRKGQAVIAIGDSYGWPRPQAYADAIEMLYAARDAERAVPALPPPPVKPGDVAKWVSATVDVRHQEATRRDVVDELVITWERATAVAALAATTDYCNRLITVFDEWRASRSPDCGPNRVRLERMNGNGEEIPEILP